MAESITFYKLQSPYPEDITKGCNLTTSDIDRNFLSLKNNDIKDAAFDCENLVLSLIKNNGQKIYVDMSCLSGTVTSIVEEYISGYTPGITDVEIYGDLSDDGILTLTLSTLSGSSTTAISGFVTDKMVGDSDVIHDSTLSGTGATGNPLRIGNTELTASYKNVIDVVDELPISPSNGDRYITKETHSDYGTLYSKTALEEIIRILEGTMWRVTTKEDWDKLLNYTEVCEDDKNHGGTDVGIMYGSMAGEALKSSDKWNGLNSYGFNTLPAGYADSMMDLIGGNETAYFWTSTKDGDEYYIKAFTTDDGGVYQYQSEPGAMYSIRLVCDYELPETGFVADIFGNSYDVVSIPETKQLWITANLDELIGVGMSARFDYDGSADIDVRPLINHWNGVWWEKKELHQGDNVTVGDKSDMVEYIILDDPEGNGELVTKFKYKVNTNGSFKVYLDAGWY